MKDSEFIELLNLYLDHEISAADAARLEAEVQGSPERRRVYQEYCRMQKACTMLAKDFVDQSAPAEARDRKVVAFEQAPRSSWGPGIFAVGGLAAVAACVAVMIVKRPAIEPASSGAGSTSETVAANQAPATGAAIVPEARVVVPASTGLVMNSEISRTVSMPVSRRSDLQPAIATHALFLSANGTVATSQAPSPEAATQLDWIKGLQLAPVQRVTAEDLRFEARPADTAKTATFGSQPRPAQQGVPEMTAFQFVK
jgi:anti-sigma factor RsiW